MIMREFLRNGILFILLLFISAMCYAQKIEENKVDEFSGHQLLTTSWEKLGSNLTNVVLFRFRYENEIRYFDLVYKNGVEDVISEGMLIQFKTADGIHSLKNSKFSVVTNSGNTDILRCIGDMSFFYNSVISKIRIHFESGYDDYEIKGEKRMAIIGNSYKLFESNITK